MAAEYKQHQKDGSVSYVTIQLRVKQYKVIMYLDVPSLLGAYMELRNLRRFGGAQRSDADQVRQHKRFADKNVYLLRKKKI